MGICNSKKEKKSETAQNGMHPQQEKITSAAQLTISKSDFIQSNNGKFRDNYQIGQLLGQGAFGEVRKCINRKTRVIRAVKLIRKESMSKEEEQSFKYEINILKKLDHPNILKLYEVFEDDKRYYLVTELCKGGELFDEIVTKVQFSEREAATIIQQILQAVSYCHTLGIVHRDLKPENVLIDKELNNTLKIIDFGTSVQYDKAKEKLQTTHGTSYYIAPEVLNKNYDERCDIWSVGVILYILLSGKAPFDGDDDHEITEQVKIGNYNMKNGIWEVLSKDAKDLIKKMLTYNFKQRVTAKEALGHPWFKNASTHTVDISLMQESLKNLAKFSATQKLQQATMSMMVQNMVTKEEISRLQQVFIQLDTNKDGKLQYDEILVGYEQFYGDMAKDEVDKIFARVDVDNSGEIDFSEFVTATADKNNLLNEEKLRAAFGYYDSDGSGSISTEEVKEVLGVGKSISEEVWLQVLKEVDSDGNGEVDFDEFKTMMMKLLN
mmetsp:Transcript_1056/g.1953  ORF Transcript_1056/g.1953 Transcript_1056/m.1953 type:complete len:494 (-) Transcript_1056:28-1509(-)